MRPIAPPFLSFTAFAPEMGEERDSSARTLSSASRLPAMAASTVTKMARMLEGRFWSSLTVAERSLLT